MLFYTLPHFSAFKLIATSALPISHICRTGEISQRFCLFSYKMGVKVHCEGKSTSWRAECAGSKGNVFHDQQPPGDPRRPWQSVGQGAPLRFHNTEWKLHKSLLSADSKLRFSLLQVYLWGKAGWRVTNSSSYFH